MEGFMDMSNWQKTPEKTQDTLERQQAFLHYRGQPGLVWVQKGIEHLCMGCTGYPQPPESLMPVGLSWLDCLA